MRKYGSSLCQGAIGELPLFSKGSLVFDNSTHAGGSFAAYVSGQFAQPCCIPGRGLECELATMTYSKDFLHQTQSHEAQRFIFKDQEVTSIMSVEERCRSAALNPLDACLAVAQFVTDAVDGELLFGNTALTVLNAPLAAPNGHVLKCLGGLARCSVLPTYWFGHSNW